jgi:glycosyltransferase involved in cell wall biosynthesis
VRDSLIEDYGVPPVRVEVVGAGANVVPASEPERADDGRTLVFVGKDGWRRKGGPVLLRAFAILRRSRPDLRLLIAGPTEAIECPARATNLGRVPLDAVERMLSQATVFVLPTLREPFGIAFLDAMICKVACVGTQVGAVPEILSEAGVCVPPANAEALAAGGCWRAATSGPRWAGGSPRFSPGRPRGGGRRRRAPRTAREALKRSTRRTRARSCMRW